MKAIDIAWAAGLFEGEGSMDFNPAKSSIRVRLNMTDRDVVQQLDNLFPCSEIVECPPSQEHHQTQYLWLLGDAPNVRKFLVATMPYFGKRRLAAATAMLGYLDSRPRATGGTAVPRSRAQGRLVDAAWAAGVFEGEGNIAIGRRWGTVNVNVKMTDRDVIDRLHVFMPCPGVRSSRPSPDRSHYLTQYSWTISRPGHIREFLDLTMPFLGERRLARAKELLAFMETRPGQGTYNAQKTHCPHNHEYTPENTYIIPGARPGMTRRVCRTCRRAYKANYDARKRRTS